MKLVAFATCTLLAMSGIANASLGSFSGSNGTDSVSVLFPIAGVLDANPATSSPSSAQFKFFFTQTSGNGAAIPGFSVNATTTAGSVDFDRINFNYIPAQSKLELIDTVGANDRKIVISNVTGPAISGSMQLQDIMLSSTSMATIFNLGNQIGGAVPVAVPEPSAFLFGGLVLGMVGAGRVVRSRFVKKKVE